MELSTAEKKAQWSKAQWREVQWGKTQQKKAQWTPLCSALQDSTYISDCCNADLKAKARHLSSIETRDSRIFLGFWGQYEMALAHTRVAFVWVIIILKYTLTELFCC